MQQQLCSQKPLTAVPKNLHLTNLKEAFIYNFIEYAQTKQQICSSQNISSLYFVDRLCMSYMDMAGSRHNRDNIFHIYTSSWDEKRPALIFLEIYFKLQNTLFIVSFFPLKNSQLKKVLPKFLNILKRICAWIHSSKPAKLLKVTLRVKFWKILPTAK